MIGSSDDADLSQHTSMLTLFIINLILWSLNKYNITYKITKCIYNAILYIKYKNIIKCSTIYKILINEVIYITH